MYSIKGEILRFNNEECYTLPVLPENLETEYTLRQTGKTAIITESFLGNTYLFNDGVLTRRFTANTYHIEPCVDFMRDYLIIYTDNDPDSEFNDPFLQIYTLKGEFVKNISFKAEMVWGIRIIDNNYFILYEWYWGPAFTRTLYKLDDVLEQSDYTGIDIEIQHLTMKDQMQFTIPTFDEINNLIKNK